MSDLQCPATIVFAAPPAIAAGVPPFERTRHLAGVYVAAPIAADPAAYAIAAELARSASAAIEVLAEAVDGATLRRAVTQLSDLHRGETVTVVAPAALLAAIGGGEREPVAVAIDSDGWTAIDAATV